LRLRRSRRGGSLCSSHARLLMTMRIAVRRSRCLCSRLTQTAQRHCSRLATYWILRVLLRSAGLRIDP
jgi:hypothetical protein